MCGSCIPKIITGGERGMLSMSACNASLALFLAMLGAHRGEYAAAVRHAESALRLHLQWGTAWDKVSRCVPFCNCDLNWNPTLHSSRQTKL